MLGLGRGKFSFPTQLAWAFRLPAKFAPCLPSADEVSGRILIGGRPYFFPPYKEDLSHSLASTATQLILNPVLGFDHFHDEGGPSDEYYVGDGGIKISTATTPWSVLHNSIFNTVVYDFVKSAATRNITRAAKERLFGVCFSTKGVHWARAGPRVPAIDLELEGKANWRIHGAYSTVKVDKNVMWLGFVNEGSNPRTPMVLGGLQFEDNLLEFDGIKLLRLESS
ncbi:Aspartic peptidase [Trema orientale]|uniref:Aspartic peptidase n=1 Tax=Trema orientale TaxID=63057 RepID=A0A2P5FWT5_TREOI|nr:Aspartic peptidase [Trema orientale]